MESSRKNNIVHIIFLILLSCLFSASLLIKIFFPNEYFEEIYFYAFHGKGRMDFGIVLKSILFCLPYAIGMFIILFGMSHSLIGSKKIIIKNKQIYPFNLIIKKRKIFNIIVFVLILGISLYNITFFDYVYNSIASSDLFEKEYKKVSKDDISIGNKKNLIMIFVESLETTLFSRDHGGDWDYEVIPEMYKLLKEDDALSFASNNLYAGESNLFGTTYTSASIISNTSGVYFRMPLRYNNYNEGHMLNNLYTLGDALRDNGYNEEVISSGDTSYGCLDYYFKRHGNPEIVDPSSLSKFGYKLKDTDYGSWGFNDRYLYNIAKERIANLASKKEPFFETLIGIDTHHIDGFKGDYTVDLYDTQFENAYRSESKLVYDFISWLKKQPYYKDTVVVITGDHTVMQGSLIRGHNPDLRKRYNLILNSSIGTTNNKNRIFTSVDMYPTVLASMGAKIKDDKLGLGVNLFSNKKTLSEDLGLEYLNKEFKKNSKYYNINIIDHN